VKVLDIAALSEFRRDAMWRKVLIDKPNMYVSLLTFEPGQEIRVHKHPDCDIWLYVVVGDAYVHSGDEEKVLRAGQGAHIPPDTWHGIVNESDTPTVVMSVQSPKARFSDWRDFLPGECPECGFHIGHPPDHDHCPMCDLDLGPLRM
jgi:quercetin dioxygenase-like cupin family protein